MKTRSKNNVWECEGYGSRFRLQGSADAVTVVLGWDKPLQTYFAQVWDGEIGGDCEEPDNLLLWAGCRWQELPTIESLARTLADYAAIPDDLRARLAEDRLSGVAGLR